MGARAWIILAVVAATGATAALRPASPPAAALAAHLERPAEEARSGSIGMTLRSQATLGTTLRARAWTLSAPGQPDGIALFTALPDAVFAPERTVTPAELAPSLARIRGLRWDDAALAWTDPAGTRPAVPLATVRDMLEAACTHPADARAILDLLTGRPSPGTPALAERLVAQGEAPPAIRIAPFSGLRGQLVNADTPPPYRTVERSYDGLLLRCEAPGWPDTWRVAVLRVTGR